MPSEAEPTEEEEIDTANDEIELAKAKGCRDAMAAIEKAMYGWDVYTGVRIELVEFYHGEEGAKVKSRMIVEDGMEG